MFEVQALLDFTDLEKKIDRREKDIFTVDTVKRLRELLGNNKRGIKSVKLLSCKKRSNQTYNGPKIIIYQNFALERNPSVIPSFLKLPAERFQSSLS